jgi:hypothetical protein
MKPHTMPIVKRHGLTVYTFAQDDPVKRMFQINEFCEIQRQRRVEWLRLHQTATTTTECPKREYDNAVIFDFPPEMGNNRDTNSDPANINNSFNPFDDSPEEPDLFVLDFALEYDLS